jgi:hypothetical protein
MTHHLNNNETSLTDTDTLIAQKKIAHQRVFNNKQAGASLENFIFWMIAAAFVLTAIVGLYNKSMSGARNGVVKTDVGVLIAGASGWGGNNKSGISMTELCKAGSNYLTKEICGTALNGVNANPYGGDYTLAVDTNTSRVKIGVTDIDPAYVTVVANDLAALSFDNCRLASGCATITVAGQNVTLIR